MRNWNKTALHRTLGRAWGKTPVKKLTALAVMLVITVSSVTTVMAAARKVTVYYNGETYTGSLTGSLETIQDTRAQLVAMGLPVDEADRVSVASNTTTGELSIYLTSAHTVTVLADGMAKSTVVYDGQTIADALQACGVTVDSNDKLTAPTTKNVTADMVIEVTRRHAVKLTADGETKNLLLEDTTVAAVLEAQGITLGKDDVVTPALSTEITADTDVTVQRVKYEEVTAQEAIPFTETVTNDSSLPRGVTRVDVQGQEGVQEVTRRNKIVDGVVTESTVLSSTVLKEAVNQVSRVGTKDPNGYATIESDGTVYDQNGNEVNYTKLLTGKCSAYTGGGTTATGAPAAFGRVAVNPNVIPYGTKLFICSPDGKVVYGYAVAADTGGACMRNSIIADLYYDTLSECYQIGVRNMNVYILG